MLAEKFMVMFLILKLQCKADLRAELRNAISKQMDQFFRVFNITEIYILQQQFMGYGMD